jgi:hypothetical protein
VSREPPCGHFSCCCRTICRQCSSCSWASYSHQMRQWRECTQDGQWTAAGKHML